MALDLTEGQLPGHALRTCYLAMRLAETSAWPPPTAAPSSSRRSSRMPAAHRTPRRSPASSAPTTSRQGPPVDDRALDARLRRVHDPDDPDSRAAAAPAAPAHLARPRRAAASTAQIEQLRCERGAAIARKAGFDERGRGRHPRPARALGRQRRPARPARRRDPPAGPDPGGLPGPRHLPRRRAASERSRSWPNASAPGTTPTSPKRSSTRARRGLLDELAAPDLVGRTMALEPGGHDPHIGRRRHRPHRARLRRHRRREEPVHRHALAAGRRHRGGSRRTHRAAGPRGGRRPPGGPAARPGQARRPEHGPRQAGPPRRLRDGGHPPPSRADPADPRHDPDVPGRGRARRLPPRAARRDAATSAA